jgi:DNA-binding CsgD family transcriptional regulator
VLEANKAEVSPESGETGIELLRFVESMSQARSIPDLGRRFTREITPLFGMRGGLHVVEPWSGDEMMADADLGVELAAFLARYERYGREVDSLREHMLATNRAAYNVGLMSMEAWLEHPLYRQVKRMYGIRHEIQAPVLARDKIVGTIYITTNDQERGFTPYEVRLAEAVGRAIGGVVERLHDVVRAEREGERMRAALALAGTAVVATDPASPEPLLNDAALQLLADIVDGDMQLQRLLAPGAAAGDRPRHLEVQLADGGTGVLRTRTSGAAAVVVLELQRDGRALDGRTLAALTPREREVALRVAEGASDREIAERLCLSPYTVRQHVKRIYRKVDVNSRVGLTRLLLGADPKR